jgi:hypothetical protein
LHPAFSLQKKAIRGQISVMTTLLDECLSESEFANQIGKALRTVRKMRARGKGPPYVKLGNSVLYRRTDAAIWLQSLITKPPRERHRN